jgi:aldehyde:ferredoxin oxidoreductase
MEYYGYAGNILYVDLSSGRIRKEPLDISIAEKFIGGWGINYRLIWDLLKPGTDPLSPDNPIIIGAGPLIGTLCGGGKIQGTTKFALPATEDGRHYVASASGGSSRFGIWMKNAGYDHLVITGRAPSPAYLKIIDDDIEICDARDLWGSTDIYKASDDLCRRYPDCGVIAIGQGGENLVRNSMAIVDKRAHFGRGGLGAVMGSKNLKAVITYGTKGIKIADTKRFMKTIKRLYGQLSEGAKVFSLLGPHFAWASTVSKNFNPGLWSVFDWDKMSKPARDAGLAARLHLR